MVWRIAMADERRRTVRLPAAVEGGRGEEVTVREYDTRALRELVSSVGVGLGVAWLLHAAGVTTNLLVLQSRACPAACVCGRAQGAITPRRWRGN